MRQKSNKVIFSVYQSGLANDVNTMSHNVAVHELSQSGFNIREIEGVYKGEHEECILVSFDSMIEGEKVLEKVEALCKLSNQESYLMIHNDDYSELRFIDGDTIDVGTFSRITEDEAKALPSYTYDPANDAYWVAK